MSKVITVAKIHAVIFWVMTSCNLVTIQPWRRWQYSGRSGGARLSYYTES